MIVLKDRYDILSYNNQTTNTTKHIIMASASANSFSAAFDTISNRQPGAKGEIEEASSGSVRVDTFLSNPGHRT